MGCSSIYCAISKLPINYGKMVMIPIVKNKLHMESDYAFCGMPIYGDYDEYSSMENIEESDYTKQLSEYFGMSIVDIVKHIMWQNVWSPIPDNGDDKLKELNNIAYFPIDREVWDSVVLGMDEIISKDHYERTPNIWAVLKYLGFEYDENERYFHKEGEEVKFVKNGGSNTVYVKGDNKSVFIKNLNTDYPQSELTDFITIPDDKKWVLDASYRELAMLMNGKELYNKFSWLIGKIDTMPRKPIDTDFIQETFKKIEELGDSEENQAEKEKLFAQITKMLDGEMSDNMTNIFLSNIDNYKSDIISLYFLYRLLKSYSTPLEPINPFFVCQGGETIIVDNVLTKIKEISTKRYERYIQ